MLRNKKLWILFTPGVLLLEPISDPATQSTLSQPDSLTTYLGTIFPIIIGLAATLAIIMIVIGGLEYILSPIPGKKEEGKRRITEAIWGLILALAAYLILKTINPNLVTLQFLIPS
ncbi:MAG: hypothetical protein HYT47_01330 [Candidatus Vogelbacteria bacterium]|nr:hypothetical protein [Candidatus Vogelbacteria bacterium]